MNPEELKQKIAEYYQKLTPNLQSVFSSMGWMQNLQQINEVHSLSEEQIQILGTETTLVLLSIISVNEYENILFSEMKLEKEVFDKILGELNDQILKPIKLELNQTFKKNISDLEKTVEKPNYSSVIYELGKKYGLLIDQVGILEEIINKVISGSLASSEFKDELESKVSIPPDKLLNLIEDINTSIFKDIRDGLKKDWEEKKEINNNITNNEISVPLPPYKNNVTKNTLVVDKEMEGIDLEKDSQVMRDHGIDIIEDKLAGPTLSEHKINDYSIPKMSSEGAPASKNKDPYRENF